jgi:hypothetical protein
MVSRGSMKTDVTRRAGMEMCSAVSSRAEMLLQGFDEGGRVGGAEEKLWPCGDGGLPKGGEA